MYNVNLVSHIKWSDKDKPILKIWKLNLFFCCWNKPCIVSFFFRKVYHNFSFFLFFFYILIGLFKCIKRVVYSLVIGLIFVPRLDRSVLVSGFEHYDNGMFLRIVIRSCSIISDEYQNPKTCTYCFWNPFFLKFWLKIVLQHIWYMLDCYT